MKLSHVIEFIGREVGKDRFQPRTPKWMFASLRLGPPALRMPKDDSA